MTLTLLCVQTCVGDHLTASLNNFSTNILSLFLAILDKLSFALLSFLLNPFKRFECRYIHTKLFVMKINRIFCKNWVYVDRKPYLSIAHDYESQSEKNLTLFVVIIWSCVSLDCHEPGSWSEMLHVAMSLFCVCQHIAMIATSIAGHTNNSDCQHTAQLCLHSPTVNWVIGMRACEY